MGVLFLIWKTGLHVFRFQKIHDLLMLGEDNDHMWRVLTDEEYYEELAKRGFTPDELEHIAFRNAARVLKDIL